MNDAWMFLSIGHAGGDRRWVGLPEVIATADGLNHLIPLAEEMQEAISTLIGAGLVEAKGVETRLTASGAAAFAEATRSDAGYIQQMLDLDAAWRARGYPGAVATPWPLDEATWRHAADAYHRDMEAKHPELRMMRGIDDDADS